MRQFKVLGVAMAAALLVACGGGGGDGNQNPAVSYTSVVSFGDSLSDAGTYGPGLIAAGRIPNATAGGMFNVNGIAGAVGADPVPSYNWAQLVSAAAVGKINCAARAGGFGMVEAKVAGCTSYAQGGARIADNVGNGNTTAGAAAVAVGVATPGPLTESVTTQIANYATDTGSATFTGKELITVLAGANDLFAQTKILQTAATAAGGTALATSLVTQLVGLVSPLTPANMGTAQTAITTAIQTEAAKATATPTSIISAAVTAAATDAAVNGYTTTAVANAATIGATAGAAATTAGNTYAATTGATNAVTAMAVAANTLATAIKGMQSNGAKHILVVNLPDVSQTPSAMSTIVYNPDGSIKDNSSQKLVLAMTTTFNNTLASALGVAPDSAANGILLVDAFSENQRQLANPAHYALTNVKDVACDPAKTLVNPADATSNSTLVCTTSTLVTKDSAGNAVTQDQALHFLFADSVHPTPYGYKLLAQYAIQKMVFAGWL
ncbi:SGNH/GDSL hydrolase family protein [Rhodoferax sp.]|uniref:SGNH/GDSL hydrolase family protein n=1 Tax=Rhodoferax sp. TaxID=50421 RepID=UPI0026362713|nr:SGNH/GDSL hydrolase family protein [Rhodoferax sp.]MDD2811418.1 SGNH/GDSL hydrolase family protein [Rhodoferax sp.]MDD4943246.1 SGNH/GDSL hydrolase family protein [Rhodoferax sp.]